MTPDHGGFQTTRWSLILRAGERWTPEAREALASMCELYRKPCFELVRKKVGDAEKAKDLTQGFFERLLEKNDLATLKPRGRFRNWLRTSISNYLSNTWDYEQAEKRGGGTAAEVAASEALEIQDDLTPEKVFDHKWAMKVIECALAALEAEMKGTARESLVEELKATLHGDAPSHDGPQPDARRMAKSRLWRRFGELLRDEVAQTLGLDDEDEIAAEIRDLIHSLL